MVLIKFDVLGSLFALLMIVMPLSNHYDLYLHIKMNILTLFPTFKIMRLIKERINICFLITNLYFRFLFLLHYISTLVHLHLLTFENTEKQFL